MPVGSMLLLTGATGLLGSGLLDHLLEATPDRQIIILTRRSNTSDLIAHPRVSVYRGDVTLPQLGLDDEGFSSLQNNLNEIIHCAADIRFGLPLDQARAINTEGTRNLLRLAARCPKLRKFAHLSTVFVVGRSTGLLAEAPLRHSNGFSNTYQQSKYEAEDLVLQAMRDIPICLYRLSSIIGDSRTGQVDQFNYVHQLLRLFPRNVLPIAPADPSAPLDLIPSDWAIAALAYLFDSHFLPGRIYHLCAGPEGSLTVSEMLDLTLGIFETHPKSRQWLPIYVPKLVSVARYEEYVERSRRANDIFLNELLRVLGFFLPHLGMFQAFDNRNVKEALAGSGLELPPPIRAYYSRVVEYCLETNWGHQFDSEASPRQGAEIKEATTGSGSSKVGGNDVRL